MQYKCYLFLSFFALPLFATPVLKGQKPAKPAVTVPLSKFKKPEVKVWLGKVNGSVTLKADEARQVITQPLKVTDDKKVDYVISSYQFAYKRIGVSEDEATGNPIAQSDVVADRFTTSPLPPVWQKNIIEGLHSGEELYFFDIIVFDKQGNRFFAPEIKITIL